MPDMFCGPHALPPPSCSFQADATHGLQRGSEKSRAKEHSMQGGEIQQNPASLFAHVDTHSVP
jgi:hypothetical protein